MNQFLKGVILICSELLWIYYLIAAFTIVEWDAALFVHPVWWIVAVISGFLIQWIFAGRLHHVPLIIINGIVLIGIIIQNWRFTVPDGAIFFGIFLSIVVIFAFLRSGQLAFKEAPRLHMLLHFEINIVIYILFAFIFGEQQIFHGLFLFAILASLMGMVLTLQNHEQDESNSDVEIQKVGNSGWFSGIIGGLLGLVALASFLLFLPGIRQALQSLTESGFNGVKWLFHQGMNFLAWIFSFLPEPESGEVNLEMEVGATMPGEEIPEEMLSLIPMSVLITIGIIVGLGILAFIIWLSSRFLKQWQRPVRKKQERKFTFQGSWWRQLTKSIRAFFQRLTYAWQVRFSSFYADKVFWHYYKLQRWGKKNGLALKDSETSKEYITRIIAAIRRQEHLSTEEKQICVTRLQKLNQDYQAAYYGQQTSKDEETYKALLAQLKNVRLNKKTEKANLKAS